MNAYLLKYGIHHNVLEAWGLDPQSIRQLTDGHINQTFLLNMGDHRLVLQKVNSIFGAEVHSDIHAVVKRLDEFKIPVPRLVRTKSKELFFKDIQNDNWRLLTFLPGVTMERISSTRQATNVGVIVGAMHAALFHWEYDYKNQRTGVHDTAAHRKAIENTIGSKRSHRLLSKVEPLYEKVAKRFKDLQNLDTLPQRHAHGDLKVTNIRFDGRDETQVAGILDLDTFAKMPLIFEMGDAFRSWCNTATEDDSSSTFDAAVFSHGARGWWSVLKEVNIDSAEVESLVSGIEWITLELATRFLRDALEESYFGWDDTLFRRSGEHQLQRALGQLSLAESVADQKTTLEKLWDQIRVSV
jgi:Ser/Thr protein kinase RdoA (MazF antagonist)